MTWLKTNFPVLFSPQFWGIVSTAFFNLVRVKGWLDADWMMFVTAVFGAATLTGITFKTAQKVGGTVTVGTANVDKMTVNPEATSEA